ncbi:MAG: hypothetical protein KQ78_00397 [Candidatus Izimaplasma bacterium HR2]|nr:MAG: hypothetical protein KQ78_00397 [Candidatus Izimaplasma bacterium HR2]
MKVTKIKMLVEDSQEFEEIDSLYLEGADVEQFYKKAIVYDYLKKSTSNEINVDGYPNTYLQPVLSSKDEKYVRSIKNGTVNDNLMKLPRE